jgi:hypothetical protein
MSDLNAHMGYQFTQIVMSHKDRFKELTKWFRGWSEHGKVKQKPYYKNTAWKGADAI